MNLQIVAADLRNRLGIENWGISGNVSRKKTPVRVVFGDPKRNCDGFGLCKMDMGESSLTSICKNAKIEYGVLISEYGATVCWLIISRQSWQRYAIDYRNNNVQTQYLRISEGLAREISLNQTYLIVDPPDITSVIPAMGCNVLSVKLNNHEA